MTFSKIHMFHMLCFEPECALVSTSSYYIEFFKKKQNQPTKKNPTLRKLSTSAYAYTKIVLNLSFSLLVVIDSATDRIRNLLLKMNISHISAEYVGFIVLGFFSLVIDQRVFLLDLSTCSPTYFFVCIYFIFSISYWIHHMYSFNWQVPGFFSCSISSIIRLPTNSDLKYVYASTYKSVSLKAIGNEGGCKLL